MKSNNPDSPVNAAPNDEFDDFAEVIYPAEDAAIARFNTLKDNNDLLGAIQVLRDVSPRKQFKLLTVSNDKRGPLLHDLVNDEQKIALSQLMGTWPIRQIDRAVHFADPKGGHNNTIIDRWESLFFGHSLLAQQIPPVNLVCFYNITQRMTFKETLSLFSHNATRSDNLSYPSYTKNLTHQVWWYLLHKKLSDHVSVVMQGLYATREGSPLPEELLLNIAAEAAIDGLYDHERFMLNHQFIYQHTLKIAEHKYQVIKGIFSRRGSSQEATPQTTLPELSSLQLS